MPLSNSAAVVGFVGLVVALVLIYGLAWWIVSNGWALWRRFRPRLVRSYDLTVNRPLGRRLAERFPRLFAAIAGRVDPQRFQGLPLTLLAVAAAYVAVEFFGLVEAVMSSEEIDSFDNAVQALVTPLRNPIAVKAFEGITQLGSTYTLAAVAIVATGFLWARGPAWGIGSVWIAIAGSQITTWTGKFVVDRPRPAFLLDVTAWSPSFPSGHATGSMAVYGIVAYVIARDLPSYRRRFDTTYWTAVLILAIAFSRIYLSVHFPSDVAAGLLVGGFWLLAGIAVGELLRDRARAPSQAH